MIQFALFELADIAFCNGATNHKSKPKNKLTYLGISHSDILLKYDIFRFFVNKSLLKSINCSFHSKLSAVQNSLLYSHNLLYTS